MIDVIDNKYFYLHNGAVAYLFGLLSNHQLEHLYYGEDLGELSKNDLEYMSLHPNKASGTVKYSKKLKILHSLIECRNSQRTVQAIFVRVL